MEHISHDPTSIPPRPDEPELDLYTIPSHSSWFLWDEIHETEKTALKEFFDGSSISRNPKIYKEYRDFIINKYREEPSRRLTFTEVRKSLVGDVSLLHKVFHFLDKWGLINFGAPLGNNDDTSLVVVVDEGDGSKVKVEGVVPNAIRVGATPNSPKPIMAPPSVGDVGESGLKLPPLASYSNVFGDLVKREKLVCGNCGGDCGSGHYEYTKGEFIICTNCFKNGNYGENRSMDDFKLSECAENSGNRAAVWTEAETLLLLDSVLKHGDDWELVVQNVQTKTKLDCILKLIELPFGELILGSAHRCGNFSSLNGNVNSAKELQFSSSGYQETIKTEGRCHEQTNESEQNGDAVNQGPSKRQCIASLSDASSSLMKQVAFISTMVGPPITAAAAEAAVRTLCDENSFPREIFDVEEDYISNGLCSPTSGSDQERVLHGEDSEMKERSTQSETQDTSSEKDDIPLILRIRASIGTALGAAAAHSKLLADQEDREIENLVATIIETQMNKLHHKIKHFEDLELIMEKEYVEMEELKGSLIAERIDFIQRAINAGISRWRDHSTVKS